MNSIENIKFFNSIENILDLFIRTIQSDSCNEFILNKISNIIIKHMRYNKQDLYKLNESYIKLGKSLYKHYFLETIFKIYLFYQDEFILSPYFNRKLLKKYEDSFLLAFEETCKGSILHDKIFDLFYEIDPLFLNYYKEIYILSNTKLTEIINEDLTNIIYIDQIPDDLKINLNNINTKFGKKIYEIIEIDIWNFPGKIISTIKIEENFKNFFNNYKIKNISYISEKIIENLNDYDEDSFSFEDDYLVYYYIKLSFEKSLSK